MTMKTLAAAALLFFVLGGGLLFAQENEGDDGSGLGDVVVQLEEINKKLDDIFGDKKDKWEGAPDEGFGGGPFFAVRYFPLMGMMNDYIESLGSYVSAEPLRNWMFPFVDGGGGTWRGVINKNLQFGMNYYGYGQSRLGHMIHQTNPEAANSTIDENGDGYDDYYTYASYGYSMWTFLGQGKVELAPELLYMVFGGQFGFGGEDVYIASNSRNVLQTALGIYPEASSWSRSLFMVGGYAGIQLRVDGKQNVVKLGLNTGFDYHIPMGDWMPEAGVHRLDPAPPAGFNSMNWWISFGPDFHF